MILGTPEQERALAKQLDCIFDAQPHAVLGGSLGRAAIYGQFGYDAVPLSLADPAHRVSRLRDIDLMFTDEHLFGMDCRPGPAGSAHHRYAPGCVHPAGPAGLRGADGQGRGREGDDILA